MEEKISCQNENKLTAKEIKEEEKRKSAIKEGFVFDEKDKNRLVKYEGINSVVVIPDFVTSIEKRTFYLCDFINAIVIPKSVKEIEAYAIERCDNLTIYCEKRNNKPDLSPKGWYSLWNGLRPVYFNFKKENFVVQNGIQYLIIDGNAVVTGHTFELEDNVIIPSTITVNKTTYNVTSIGPLALSGCESLYTIEIPSSITSIKFAAFSGCESLTSVLIPSSVTSIEEHAFSSCDSITFYCEASRIPSKWDPAWNQYKTTYCGVKKEDIIFQNGLQYLIIYGIALVTGYTPEISNEVIIPSTITVNEESYVVKFIGDEAFSGCGILNSIFIPNSVLDIGKKAFYNCQQLTSVILPSGITSIRMYTFHNCNSLTSIVIPEGVKSIGEYAFSKCRSLTSIVIPIGVTTMERNAFSECDSLTIYCESTIKIVSLWKKSSDIDDRPTYWKDQWSYVDGVPTPKNHVFN